MDGDGFDYESIPIGYYDRVFTRRRGVQSKWHHLKFERIRAVLDPGGVHLDIGCGPGTFIGSLESTRLSVGADISQAQLAYARGHYGGERRLFIRIGPGSLPFADNTFDNVTLVELIEHLDDQAIARLLKEARRVLKPGGRMVLSTPNYRSLWPVVETLLNRLGKVDYTNQHINHFDKRRMREAMHGAGLSMVSLQPYQFAAPFAAVFGWRFADLVARLEPEVLTARLGMLLMATATKS